MILQIVALAVGAGRSIRASRMPVFAIRRLYESDASPSRWTVLHEVRREVDRRLRWEIVPMTPRHFVCETPEVPHEVRLIEVARIGGERRERFVLWEWRLPKFGSVSGAPEGSTRCTSSAD